MDRSRTIIETDNSTLELNSWVLRIKDGGVPRPKLASVGQQISSSSGAFTTASSSYVDVTNLSVAITTTGRPVILMLIAGDYTQNCYVGVTGTTDPLKMELAFVRDSTTITDMWFETPGTSASSRLASWGAGQCHIDTPAAGTYTYKVQIRDPNSVDARAYHLKLVAYEL